MKGFQSGSGAAQYYHRVLLLRSDNRHISAIVARGLFLFVGRVVFFIDDNETEIGKRREDG